MTNRLIFNPGKEYSEMIVEVDGKEQRRSYHIEPQYEGPALYVPNITENEELVHCMGDTFKIITVK